MAEDLRHELAEFLRIRRTRLQPRDVGLEPGPRRRVAGLRREELALLAGVSADYYQRIEQGRDLRPSEPVLDALARALRLSAEETRHLHSLAALARTPAAPARHREPETVPPSTLRLLNATATPAMVVGRFLDILAWNPPAGLLLGAFTGPHGEHQQEEQEQRDREQEQPQPQAAADARHRPEVNLLALLLGPQADRSCPERAATVAELTGMLRTQVTADPGHPRAAELVGELAVHSDEFAALWARHDVEETTRGRMRVQHPVVGELDLDWDAYPLPGAPGPMMFVCTARDGGRDAERLALLCDLPAPAAPAGHAPAVHGTAAYGAAGGPWM